MSVVAERLRALRANLPPSVEHKEITVPEGIPGYSDWNALGVDPWKPISDRLYSDGASIILWTALDPERGWLIWGDEAKAIMERLR